MPAATPRTAPVPIIGSVQDLARSADAWICDIWGVMHNGAAAFAAAADAGRRFRAAGGTVLLLSNAPRPAGSVVAQLDRLGVPRDAYDRVVSSGDLTRRLLAARPGARVFHLGPEKDLPIFDGLDVTLTAAADADVFVCSGLLDDDHETPDDYRDLLASVRRSGLTMICANPDLTVERGTQLLYCAGALAEVYEAMGGTVTYAGKPHLPAYDLAFATLAELRGNPVAPGRVLAIGDGLRTDIRGAHRAGIRSLFIASAVHVKEPLSEGVLRALFDGAEARPVAAMAALAW